MSIALQLFVLNLILERMRFFMDLERAKFLKMKAFKKFPSGFRPKRISVQIASCDSE